jgi:hypothetical protein
MATTSAPLQSSSSPFDDLRMRPERKIARMMGRSCVPQQVHAKMKDIMLTQAGPPILCVWLHFADYRR